ncbi:MAG: cyclic nucleotide-binding domain-containing protein [Bacteroidetes bacterium]|nr:cyclic nucleotide-binding domain-containing protein [Bacteroidota bacterium]MCH8523055.1 cyclic nucleotide-binding domain-containing protein [Balneolales bacterium]
MQNPLFRQARFFLLWQTDPAGALHEFIYEIRKKGLFEPDIVEYNQGDIVLKEGEKTKFLFILMDGCVRLYKQEEGASIPVTDIEPGGLFGVMSFFSNKHALTTAVVDKEAKIFRLNKQQVEHILTGDMTLSTMGRQMLTANLMDRYAHVIQLNVQLKKMNHEIDLEHSKLQEAMRELKSAHNRLVHQEKMATLGQLVAGVAHEINNPAAALENAVSYLADLLPELFKNDTSKTHQTRQRFFIRGVDSRKIQTSSSRDSERLLRSVYPSLKSSEIRKLVLLDDDGLDEISKLYKAKKLDELRICLDYMEAGMHLRLIRITTERIGGLVKSLKRYSRQGSSEVLAINLREGIMDTLHVLGNRLKDIKVHLDVDETLPDVKADPAEMNQVWTNIVVNACDILNDKGHIDIISEVTSKAVIIRIGDDGPGVPEELRETIFKPSFTTRNSSGNYGLGLGLSISRELIMKHGGTIEVISSRYGGAEFVITMPRYELTPNRIMSEISVY